MRSAAGAVLILIFLFAGLAIVLPSCAGDPSDARREGDRNPPLPSTPTEGTIVFYDPSPKLRGKRMAPALLKITTEGEKASARDTPMRLDAGTIEEEGPEKPTGKGVSREILKQVRERTATVISPERFADLWKRLEEAKVFTLPRHRGGIPPEDRPSISITAGGRSWVLVQPPRNSESFKTLYEAWVNGKKLIYLYAF